MAVAALTLSIFLVLRTTTPPALAQSPDPALRGHGGPIRSIAVLDANTVVTGGFDAAIIVWDLASGTAKRVLRFHDGAVTALVARSGSRSSACFASGGDDGQVAEWCLDEKGLHNAAKVHADPIAALVYEFLPTTADAQLLHSGSWDHSVRSYESRRSGSPAGMPANRISAEHKAPISGLAVAYHEKPPAIVIVSSSSDGMVRVTDSWTGQFLRQSQLPAAVNGLAVLPDNRIVLTAADGRVRVLNLDLTPSFEIELPDGPLTAVAVSPDGRTIAVAGMRTPVALIDVAARSVARRILGPGLPIWALAFSTDSRELLTGGADRALRRWTVATGEPAGEALSPAADLLGQSDNDASREPGARVFRACVACHTVQPGDVPRAGPSLAGIMGRRIAAAPGYVYSDALKKLDIVWTPDTIARLFEVGPAIYTPGTKMPEQRLTDPADRKALTDWLAKVTKP